MKQKSGGCSHAKRKKRAEKKSRVKPGAKKKQRRGRPRTRHKKEEEEKKEEATPVVIKPVVDTEGPYMDMPKRKARAKKEKKKKRKRQRNTLVQVLSNPLGDDDITKDIADSVKFDMEDRSENSLYKRKMFLRFMAPDSRVKDPCMELWLQKTVLNAMRTMISRHQDKFHPIGLVSPLALEPVLNKFRRMQDKEDIWEKRKVDECITVLTKQTGLVRVYDVRRYPANAFADNRAKLVVDHSGAKKWQVEPKYDFVVAPIFNREVGHWSVIVMYLRCAIETWNKQRPRKSASDYVVHYDTIPGTNNELANFTVMLFQRLGYFPRGVAARCTEAFSQFKQEGNWECGYFVIRLVFELCRSYSQVVENQELTYTPMLSGVENVSQTMLEETRSIVVQGLNDDIYMHGKDPMNMISSDREKLIDCCFFNNEMRRRLAAIG